MIKPISELVSVIIPSRNRPQLASKAVRSVLAQTVQSIEVIVVVDGPDPATVEELQNIEDPRLIVIELPKNIGPSAARNAGIKEAKGTWIAFLDDDDEWLPEKIERQLAVAQQSKYTFPVVASRFIARTAKGELIWPRRLPRPSEPIAEYLFVRRSLFLGEGTMQTSTFFTKKELLMSVPLGNNLTRHEDWDWLIRVSALPGVGLEFAAEPLAIWYSEIERKRLSNINDWHYSLDWIRSVRNLVTPRAYSGFVTTVVASQAARAGDWQAFLPILGEAFRMGKLQPFDLLLYLSMWLLPQDLRHTVRSLLTTPKKRITQSQV